MIWVDRFAIHVFFSGQKLTKKWTNRVYAAKHLAIVWCLFSWNGVRRVWLHITCEFFKKNLPFFGSFYQDPWIYHSPRMLVTTKIITFLSSGIPTETFICDWNPGWGVYIQHIIPDIYLVYNWFILICFKGHLLPLSRQNPMTLGFWGFVYLVYH